MTELKKKKLTKMKVIELIEYITELRIENHNLRMKLRDIGNIAYNPFKS